MGSGERQAIKTPPLGAKWVRNKGRKEMATPGPLIWPGAWDVVLLPGYWGHVGISGAPLIPLDLGGCPAKWLAYTLAARCTEKQWGEGGDKEEQSLEESFPQFILAFLLT